MNRLNITPKVLDKLGFSEYWDEHCTWGGRTLTFSNGVKFRIVERCEGEEEYDMGLYAYVAQSYYFAEWFAMPKMDGMKSTDLFFIHEMYECIAEYYPECLEEFTTKCKYLKMDNYLELYLK